ncbi:hypothetical protein BDQ12DRAFT_687304 [Crucibulum laeve]|uniref:Uncharacterized protein n=1 Tax=Crucibulum laeve TaxID=68775 RepID=A0A5C3LSK5_9AGAR|nr:hypothetical protein BDQ12DRAFT_687304 [Crucibulum laeve]
MQSSSSYYSSTASLVSKQTPSYNPVGASKNYEAAFGALSSSYGFGSGVPSVPKSSKITSTSSSRSYAHSTSSSSQSPKNYEAAFGSLSSTYGFGGSAPAPLNRKS